MKRILACLILVLSLFLVSCSVLGTRAVNKDSKISYMTFTDSAGKTVTLSHKPKKIAVLFSSHAQMVMLSGASVDITVGEAVERGFANKDALLVDGGAGKQINTELLIAGNPDFVIGSYDIPSHVKIAEVLENTGIPCALFRVESFSDYSEVMRILCDIFERDDLYCTNVTLVEKGIEEVLSSVDVTKEKKKILFVRCASTESATKAKTRNENFVCQMLYELNTHNIAEDAPVLLDGLGIEYIMMENPDYIFFSPMGNEQAAKDYVQSLLSQPAWQSLDCVKKGSYTFLPKDMFQYKPCNKWDEAYKYLAEKLYAYETP